MRKFLAVLLAAMMVLSMATIASAETTTLTTTVPDATYTLNVPANQEIAFGAESTDIGTVTITDSSNFAKGKNISVTVTYGDFTCADTTTTIPMALIGYGPESVYGADTRYTNRPLLRLKVCLWK